MMKTFSAVCLALSLVSGHAVAQSDYPNRPIKLWHGFGAGGNADTVARIIAMKMSEGLNQTVLVDAKTGAGGNIASDMVAKMPADGYNLILLTGGHAVSGAMYKQLPFDPVNDFSMVSTLMFMPFVIGTSADSPIKSIADLIEAAKREPGKLSYSSVGVGSTQHLAGELFSSLAGVDMIHVPYRGGAAPVQDVMTQRVTVLFDTLTPTTPHIRSGKLRALAVTSRDRAPSVPEVPSASEALPAYEVTSWLGIAAPAKLPADVLRRLNQEVARVVALPDVRQRLMAFGGAPRSGSPEQMRTLVDTEVSKWRKVVNDAKIPRQ
jgi:tripartite-type tricarboxylate transporter receptor subunit TctC